MLEAQYAGAVYPAGSALAGKKFDPANGGVNLYSADVMVPAFLASYTSMGGKGLSIFPSLTKLLPNWTVRYSGLGKLRRGIGDESQARSHQLHERAVALVASHGIDALVAMVEVDALEDVAEPYDKRANQRSYQQGLGAGNGLQDQQFQTVWLT